MEPTIEGEQPLATRLQQAHLEIDEALVRLWSSLEADSLIDASVHLEGLRTRLRSHRRAEEAVLYPIFAARTLLAAAIESLRLEHRTIATHADDLGRAIDGGRLPEARELCGTLTGLIGQHQERERLLIYPQVDRVLSDGERAALLSLLYKPKG